MSQTSIARPYANVGSLAAALWIAALWLALHPLVGQRHDAVLYAGQALARLDPSAYAGDVFLTLSGQDRFTVATALTSRLYTVFGIGLTNATLLLLTQSLSAMLLFLLVRPLVGVGPALAGLILYAGAAQGYGPQQKFAVAEAFFTARSLAEPLVWAALLALQRSRRAPAGVLLAGASLMHPLIALPGWVVWWCWELSRDRRWLWLLPAVAAAAALGGEDSLRRFDPAWRDIIELRNTVFIAQMSVGDACKALLASVVLCQGSRMLPGGGELLRAVLWTAVLMVTAAALLADVLGLALATQLQLWRGLWVLQGLGVVLWPWWTWHQARAAGPWRISAMMASLAAFTAVNATAPSAPWLLGWCLLHAALARYTPRHAALPRALATVSALLLALATAASVEFASLRSPQLMSFAAHLAWAPWLGLPVLGLGLAAGLAWSAQHVPRTAAVAGVLVLAVTAAIWDQRSPLMLAVDAVKPPVAHRWKTLIPPGTPVVWMGHPEAVWALLRRPVLHDEVQNWRCVSERCGLNSNHSAKRSCSVNSITSCSTSLANPTARRPRGTWRRFAGACHRCASS
jgi:hypothetical protein